MSFDYEFVMCMASYFLANSNIFLAGGTVEQPLFGRMGTIFLPIDSTFSWLQAMTKRLHCRHKNLHCLRRHCFPACRSNSNFVGRTCGAAASCPAAAVVLSRPANPRTDPNEPSRVRCLVAPRVLPSPLAHEPELQRDAQPAENGFCDEGKSRHARAGDGQEMAGNPSL